MSDYLNNIRTKHFLELSPTIVTACVIVLLVLIVLVFMILYIRYQTSPPETVKIEEVLPSIEDVKVNGTSATETTGPLLVIPEEGYPFNGIAIDRDVVLFFSILTGVTVIFCIILCFPDLLPSIIDKVSTGAAVDSVIQEGLTGQTVVPPVTAQTVVPPVTAQTVVPPVTAQTVVPPAAAPTIELSDSSRIIARVSEESPDVISEKLRRFMRKK